MSAQPADLPYTSHGLRVVPPAGHTGNHLEVVGAGGTVILGVTPDTPPLHWGPVDPATTGPVPTGAVWIDTSGGTATIRVRSGGTWS